MLEAVLTPPLDHLPWSAGAHGLDIIDREGDVLFHANQMYAFARLSWSDRVVATQQRCARVAQIANVHEEMCSRLAELIALSTAAYRMLADLDADVIARSDWAVVIERAVKVMEKVHHG